MNLLVQAASSDDGATFHGPSIDEFFPPALFSIGGFEVYRLEMPAAVGVKEGINLPRYPTLPGRSKSKKAEVASVTAEHVAGGLATESFDNAAEVVVQTTILGRGPDAGGLVYWIGQMRSGRSTLTKMADGFARSTEFVRRVGIESRTGFEVGLELTAKATRMRLPVAEIPTIWLDRQLGTSRFDLGRFLPRYLHWYGFAFGRRLTYADLERRGQARSEQAAQPAAEAASAAELAPPQAHATPAGAAKTE